MPILQVYQNLRIHMEELAELFDLAFEQATYVARDRKMADLEYADGIIGMQGVFTYDSNGEIVSGILSRLEILPNDGSWVEMTHLNIDIATLRAALAAEAEPGVSSALEDYVYGLDWTIRGTPMQEDFTTTETSSEGVSISWEGNNTVRLGDGQDQFFAGGGDDYIMGERDQDTISGGDGNDTILGGHGKDRLDGQKGNDHLIGGRGHDRLFAAKGDDLLEGGLGKDYLVGSWGSDTLDGGGGDDRLSGGQNDDTFRFLAADLNGSTDRILDFESGIDQVVIDVDGTPSYFLSEVGGDTHINVAGGVIIVENVLLDDFTAISDNLAFI